MFISAGDASGDVHASNLMQELAARVGNVSFIGYGLDGMIGAGLEALENRTAPPGAMWLHNMLYINRFRRRIALARNLFREFPPDLVILVDYGGLNLFLAKEAARAGLPVLYYILPQVWAHGRYRLKKIRKWVTRAAVIYPFEPPLCRSYGVDAEYVGHPLFDRLESRPPRKEKTRHPSCKHGNNLVAILPGSRRQEVKANLPVILDACSMIEKEYGKLRFVAACPETVRDTAAVIIKNHSTVVELNSTRPVELARTAGLCITKSGTVTLEIASQHTPMVILYRINPFLYFIASGMTHTPYAGIVNALAGGMICPEKIMWRSDPHWVYRRARRFLEDEDYHARCSGALESLMERIGSPGATQKTAGIAIELMQSTYNRKHDMEQNGSACV